MEGGNDREGGGDREGGDDRQVVPLHAADIYCHWDVDKGSMGDSIHRGVHHMVDHSGVFQVVGHGSVL